MDFSRLHRGVQELLLSGVQTFAWSFRDLIGQQKEWTPTKLPRTVTTGGNVNPLDDVVLVDCSASAVTLTLESAIGCDGRQHTFKKIDSSANALTLDGNGSETIDGTANLAFVIQHVAVTVKSDGTNWRAVSYYPDGGRYTPQLASRTNVAAASAEECQFVRHGSVVTVSGRLLVDPVSASVATQLDITLPIPSDFGAQEDCAGVAYARDFAQGGVIRAEQSADKAMLQFFAIEPSAAVMFFIYMYQVI